MNALTRFDPAREVDELQNRLARFFGLAPARATSGGEEVMTVAEWAPSVEDKSKSARLWKATWS
jgi:HSP20 family protein